jgi:hypothetical protein
MDYMRVNSHLVLQDGQGSAGTQGLVDIALHCSQGGNEHAPTYDYTIRRQNDHSKL